MDSQPPTPLAQAAARRLRPWYLVLAMVLTWLVGVSGLMSGCSTVTVLQQDSVADITTELGKQSTGDPVQAMWVAIYSAQFKATIEAHAVTFPLNVAKLLLSGLLVVASVLAMGGRPGARPLALQALAANALLAAIDYALTRSVRASWIEAVGRVGDMLPRSFEHQRDLEAQGAALQLITSRHFWWWFERIRFLMIDLGIFGFGAIALTRQRTRVYFEAVAEAAEPSEDP
ncbi:MAG TPA: hypothetical protein VE093_27390 [Polyangiaceae bacterium]|nr:hypothetical protein [Polyangiaceae bacterium]